MEYQYQVLTMSKHIHFSLYNFLNALGQLIALSILWAVCSLPVITIGASSTALYYAVVKVVRRDRGSVLQSFFGAFRSNFWQSLTANMMFLCYFAVLAFLATPKILAWDGSDISLYIIAGFALLGACPMVLCWPVISRFYHRGPQFLRFLLLLTARHTHVPLISVALLSAGGVMALSNGAALIFVPGLYAYAQSMLLEPVFQKYSSQDDPAGYETWYEEAGT